MAGDLFVLKLEGPCGFVNCFDSKISTGGGNLQSKSLHESTDAQAGLFEKFIMLIPYCVPNALDLCVLSRSSRINKSSKRSSNTWTYGMSSVNRLRDPMTRHLKPLSSMMIPHRLVWMIRLRSIRHDKFCLRFCFFGMTRPPSVLFLQRDTLPD